MRVENREELRQMIKNNEDISNVDTSQITDMKKKISIYKKDNFNIEEKNIETLNLF